jgi:putative OPT family oligopeptide transporter
MAVCVGVIFTAPLVQILYAERNAAEVGPLVARITELRHALAAGGAAGAGLAQELAAARARYAALVPPIDVPTLMFVSLAGSLIGYGFVGLATRKFLTDPTLPAPEARACQTLIQAAAAERGARPALSLSLFPGLALSFLAPLLAYMGLAKRHVSLFTRSSGDRNFSLDLSLSEGPIYLGIGGLLTLSTALLVFGGSFLRVIGDFALAGIDPASGAAALFPANSMRWVGGAAMTVAVVYSLFKFMRPRAAGAQGAGDLRLVEVEPRYRLGQLASVAAGLLALVGWILAKDGFGAFALVMGAAVLVMSMLMVTLGALLSLQIGSSASPVSGTIFVTTLVLCLAALAVGRHELSDVLLLSPLLVGACVAVCAANDSSQDYKTLQLCGIRAQDGFLAQILGLVAGALVVPIALYVAHEAYVLGSPDLTAPQGTMFATLINGLLLERDVPVRPIAIGLCLGAFAVALEVAASRRKLQLPSMALAVGIYLPAALGIGILIGAGFRWLGERGQGKQRHESILAAAGLITGAAALQLLLGVLIVARPGFSPDRSLALGAFPSALTTAVALAGILALGLLIFANSRPRAR